MHPRFSSSVGSANSSESEISLGNKTDKTALSVSELNFTGQIRSPKDISKLSFSSSVHQIGNAKNKNYSDLEICEATIKAMPRPESEVILGR